MNKLKYLIFVLSFIISLNLLQVNALANNHSQDLYEETDDESYDYDSSDEEEGDSTGLYE